MQVAAVGGPFVPLTLRKDAGAFERQLYRIHVARANVEKLTRTLGAVPVRKPIMGEIDLSSGFGVRSDPFLGRPAMHTGLDFRSSTGDPVRATANGTVESAGWSGGYGKMVEIDHGNGFSTRYGHMSEIEVKVGQQIKIGQIIGRVGSTGRSTGPHLHYETRIDGDAVDPQKFLRAGLAARQRAPVARPSPERKDSSSNKNRAAREGRPSFYPLLGLRLLSQSQRHPAYLAAQDVSLARLKHDSRHAQANRSRGSDRKKSDPHGAFLLSRVPSSSIGLHGILDGKPLITRRPDRGFLMELAIVGPKISFCGG